MADNCIVMTGCTVHNTPSAEEVPRLEAEIERLTAELAHIHKDRTAWANVELSEENDRLIAENERLRKIETAARALKFSAYPAHGSGFVLQVHGGNINDLEAALGSADEQ